MYEIQEAYDEFYDMVENSRMYTEAGADLDKQRRAKIALAIVVIGGAIIAIAAIIRHIKKEKLKKEEELINTLVATQEEAKKIKSELKKYDDKIKRCEANNKKKKKENMEPLLTDAEWAEADELCKKTKAINKKITDMGNKLGLDISIDEYNDSNVQELSNKLLRKWNNEHTIYLGKKNEQLAEGLKRKKELENADIKQRAAKTRGEKREKVREERHDREYDRAGYQGTTRRMPHSVIADAIRNVGAVFGKNKEYNPNEKKRNKVVTSSADDSLANIFLSINPSSYMIEMTDDDIHERAVDFLEFVDCIADDTDEYIEKCDEKYEYFTSLILEKADNREIDYEKCVDLLTAIEDRFLV